MVSIMSRSNPLGYTTWDVLENKTNVTSYPNTGLLKTTIADTIIEKKWRL